ncbi:TPA: type 1 fimbrial protein [Klebsiella aerogenes]|uniref:fimbrial protein n=1 Tax=Klebsiella aerogenes TaxID=548 RepID=UPI0014951D11|nr:type 1 fimbrial protein [Klebsiella aerogenes]NPD52875.1 type 1 fimbrial protein [Klebsiella aerogenes]NPD80067.1 type 1 fimbrial protein [Klebsiella aerogenes]HBT2490136.1 type 1 fimbrial protein [Klebsiella aerogenes]HBT2500651.1 type 1 fimbrial protein [Klebsiella aerogenes]
MQRFCNGLIIILFGLMFSYISISFAANININFKGFIRPGSCDVDLDQSSLNLGDADYFTLKVGNVLLNPTKFNVNISNCYLVKNTILRPAIQIGGEGFNADGKFIFSSRDSTANGIGVLLYKGVDSPSYSDPSIKAGDYIDLGGSGAIPEDSIIPFYVGVTCGSVTDCASTNVVPGKMIARIIFNYRYY